MFIDDRAFGAPLIKPNGFLSPVIDWTVILDKFRNADSFKSSVLTNLIDHYH